MDTASTGQPIAPPRRAGGARFWLLLVGGLLLLSCVVLGSCLALVGASTAAAIASQPTATPEIVRFVPGPQQGGASTGRVTTHKWVLSVTGVETQQTLTGTPAGTTQDAAGQWLLITAYLRNQSSTNHQMNASDFEVHDGAGHVYQHSAAAAALTYPATKGAQSASKREVSPNVTVPLILVFDVPAEATGLQLVFKEGHNPRIDLGR